MEISSKTPVNIYAESTPNPASMKFVANKMLIADGATAEYRSPAEAKASPLAQKLFQFPFVKNVFISSNFVTLNKTSLVNWEEVMHEIRDFLKKYIDEGHAIVTELPKQEVHVDSSFKETKTVFTEHAAPKDETEHKIIEILEQYIRPAVEQDGGLIVFRSFEEGKVTLVLKGACSGCPSSTLTLKAGIEGLLKRMVPSVKEVVAENA